MDKGEMQILFVLKKEKEAALVGVVGKGKKA